MKRLRIKAPAKINLHLEILGLRADGYHEIQTILQTVDLCDELELTETENFLDVECDEADCPSGERNLAYTAADKLKKSRKVEKGVCIKIKKRIPAGGGLGGGSSDAAAVLKGLNQLWDLRMARDDLEKIAEKIGSDVPFFIKGGVALARGRGEILTDLPSRLRPFCTLLLNPGFEISTKWAYSLFKQGLTRLIKSDKNLVSQWRNSRFLGMDQWKNSFESVICDYYPDIARLKEALLKTGATKAVMTGSGSTVFGLYESRKTAERAAEVMKADKRVSWLRTARILSEPYLPEMID